MNNKMDTYYDITVRNRGPCVECGHEDNFDFIVSWLTWCCFGDKGLCLSCLLNRIKKDVIDFNIKIIPKN